MFSSIGLGYLVYGRRQKNKIVFYSGVGLVAYPYFVPDLLFMIAIGVLLLAAPRLIRL